MGAQATHPTTNHVSDLVPLITNYGNQEKGDESFVVPKISKADANDTKSITNFLYKRDHMFLIGLQNTFIWIRLGLLTLLITNGFLSPAHPERALASRMGAKGFILLTYFLNNQKLFCSRTPSYHTVVHILQEIVVCHFLILI